MKKESTNKPADKEIEPAAAVLRGLELGVLPGPIFGEIIAYS